MRNNQPVTGNAYTLEENQSLISRTDTHGNLTYVNKNFIDVSGFSEAELLGAPHSIVRHPDMPVEAFADMWETLKRGSSWTGMVKNRCKNGDHYWVLANATPIRENGAIVGYSSVRTAPSREQIAQASAAYALFKQDRAGSLHIRSGQVVRGGVFGKISSLKDLHIKGRLTLLVSVLCLLMTALGVLGLYGMSASNAGLQTVYADRTVPLGQLDQVVRLLQRNRQVIAETSTASTPETMKNAAGKVESNIEEVQKIWNAFSATALTPEEKKQAEQFTLARTDYLNRGLTPAIIALKAGNIDEVKRLEHEVMAPGFVAVRDGIDALIQLQLDVAKQEVDHAQAHFVSLRNTMAGAILLGLMLSFFAVRLLVRSIVGPLNEAVNVAKEIAAGNLTADIDVESSDEIGQLQHALNVMKKSLTNIISGVRRNADMIESTSTQIAHGNNDLSQRTEQQASTLEETAASMEQLTSTVKNNAENSKQARELAHVASDIALQGGEAMSQVVGTMDSIAHSSKKITDIIGVIDGIAFQTNILALNAAVEAARAGEQGRGFAVVATEVRSLAQRSASAAREIKELISDSVSRVETGSQQVTDARKTIEGIVNAVQQVTGIMNEITTASMEQSSGIEQVNQAVMQMDGVTQQNAALVEQAAAAAETLQAQGHSLAQGMGVFRLGGASGPAMHAAPRAQRNGTAAQPADIAASRKQAARSVSSSPIPASITRN